MRVIFPGLIIAAFLLLGIPAHGQVQPADNAIKSAMYDLTRYEKQAAGFTPSRKSNIKRTLRLLQNTEKRLQQSPNKAHPSWIAANKRLTALKGYLAKLLGGGAPPARAAKPAPPAPKAAGVSPALKSVVADLDRYEKQAAGLNPSRKGQVRRTLKLLEGTEARLGGIRDKKQPEWIKAEKRLTTLKGYLTGMLGSAPPVAGSASKTPPAAQQAKPSTAPAPGSTPGGAGEMNPLEKKLLADLDLDIRQAWGQLKKARVLSFQDKRYAAQWRNRIKTLKDKYGRIPGRKSPQAKDAAKKIAYLGKTVEGGIAKANQLLAEVGDVRARFAQIYREYQSLPLLDVSEKTITEKQVGDYVSKVKAVKASTAEHLVYVKSVKGKTIYAGPKDIKKIERFLTLSVPGRLQKGAKLSTDRIDEKISASAQEIDVIKNTDPNNPTHARNRLVGKGLVSKSIKRLDGGIALVRAAQKLDAGVGRKKGPDRALQIKKFEDAKKEIQAKFRVAVGKTRMPEIKSKDPKLIKQAKGVLASGRNKEIYPHERMIVNYDIRRNSKKTAYSSGGVVTFHKYVWDEYQVATAEKIGDEYFVYFNTIRFYHEADPKTTRNKWILGRRHRGSQILKENIHK